MDPDFRESKNVMLETSALTIQVFQAAIELSRKSDDPEFAALREAALAGRSLDSWVQELLDTVGAMEGEEAVAGKEGEETAKTDPMRKIGDHIQDQAELLSPVVPIVQSIRLKAEQTNTAVQPSAVADVKAAQSDIAVVVKPGDDIKVVLSAFAEASKELEKETAKVAVATVTQKVVPKKEIQKEEDDYDYYDEEEEAPKVPPKVLPPKSGPTQIKMMQPNEAAGKEDEYSDYYYSDE